jgi:hypothetical protein
VSVDIEEGLMPWEFCDVCKNALREHWRRRACTPRVGEVVLAAPEPKRADALAKST